MKALRVLAPLVFVLVLGFGTSPAVLAHGGRDDSFGQSTTEAKQHAQDLVESYKKQARQATEQAKEKTHEKSAELRQKACTVRKDAMQKHLSTKVAAAEKHKEVFDKIFTKVQNYYNQKELNVDNYEALVGAVQDTQADTTEKLLALKSVDVSIDCSDPGVANTIGTFKEALGDTRDSLKAYKTALKQLISAVRQAAESSSGV